MKMRITRLYCKQFAGLRGVDISLGPGLNVLLGGNESGKSTLVNLLSRILFQSPRMDARRDRPFMVSFFPAEFRDGRPSGDGINGAIAFETDSGPYVLYKVWRKGKKEPGIAKLRTPDGDELNVFSAIEVTLKRELVYGEGVFSEILFSSQAVGEASLRTLLEEPQTSRSGREMAAIVTRAFAESGAATSISELEAAIKGKIKELEGEHWDAERDAPERRNTSAPWKTGIGEVLKAYYALEDVKREIAAVMRLEEEAKRASAVLIERENAYFEAVSEAEKFQEISSRLAGIKWRLEKLEALRKSLDVEERAAAEWPELDEKLKRAGNLKEELRQRDILDRFERVDGLNASISGFDKILKNAPSPEDIVDARDAEERIRLLERQLGGMRLSARVRMESGHSIEVASVRTGEKLEAEEGTFTLTEAVAMSVPGVMTMLLSPDNVNAEEAGLQLDELRSRRDAIFQRYLVHSLDELKSRGDECARAFRERERAELQRDGELRGTTYETLRESREAVNDPRPKEAVEADILVLCDATPIDAFIARTETLIEKNIRDFGSMEALAERVAANKREKEKLEEQTGADRDIPEKYLAIEDPERHLKRLQEAVRARQTGRDEALQSKSAAMSKWEAAVPDDGLEERLQVAKRRFSETQAALKRWKHILQVFEIVKGQSLSNPVQGLADHFARYLSLITGDRLSSNLSEENGLNVKLSTHEGRALDYGKLSEGTKDAVALAFRLAVIDHLYPEGGGVAVFDDPLTDMDAPRMERSCQLIREFAQRHQALFLTCREEYADRLGGKLIRL
ncbi:MAG: AAA family ATPase [Synergistaceae bacterium]|nr:AAA family ATPase [Synergistaceae bacterium]